MHKIKESPDQFRETYPDFHGDINNVDQCIEHVRDSFIAKLSPDRNKETAWVEAIATCAMDQNSVRELFQQIAKKIVATHKA